MEVVELEIEKGATNFNNCLRSNNIEVVKLDIKKKVNISCIPFWLSGIEIILIILNHINKN